MGYRIEYLTETTDTESVCGAIESQGGDLQSAQSEGLAHAEQARQRGATGFQIRHVNAVDIVVAIVNFEDGE
jgi:hypothetical protein